MAAVVLVVGMCDGDRALRVRIDLIIHIIINKGMSIDE